MKKFAVIGNPINHSLSPQIHSEFARQHSIDLSYEKIMADDDINFTSTIENLINKGYSGVNVTLPFKGCAAKISTIRSSNVDLTGSANTLSFDNNAIAAHTTDGIGLVNDLLDKIGSISNSSVLLLVQVVLLMELFHPYSVKKFLIFISGIGPYRNHLIWLRVGMKVLKKYQ